MWTGKTLQKESTARNAVFMEIKLLTGHHAEQGQVPEWHNGLQKEN